jgi:regulator of replication initiation timing
MTLFAITMVRNEMPLLPLTLANLLSQGVDRVLIADHNSTDDTLGWLRRAEKADGRITVIDHKNHAFNQAAVVSSLARMATVLGATWILPFDADEFWMAADRSERLSDVLASETLGRVEAMAVRLENFAAPFDCDEFHLSDLPRFTHRFAPTAPVTTDDLTAFQQGARAFISCAYPDKFIIRATSSVLVGAGAHSVASIADPAVDGVSTDVRCLHLPLRCKRFLYARLAHGQLLKSSGYPDWHGWQNQMLVGLDTEQDLDRIWAVNSYDSTGHNPAAGGEVFILDDSLAELYRKVSTHPLLDPGIASGGPAGDSSPDLSASWLAVAEGLRLETEASNEELRSLRVTVLSRLETEAGSLRSQVGSLQTELGSREAEVASLLAEVRSLQTELGAREAEVASLLAEVRSLQTELGSREAEVASLRAEVRSLQTELGSRQAELSSRQAELASREAELASMQDANRTLQEELHWLRNSRVFRWSRPVRKAYHGLLRHRT